jgi:peptide deformylase
MVGFLRTFCAAAAGAAAATILLAPAAPPTGSAVAASSSRWRSVRTAPGTVKAGDPVLHEPAQEVALGDIPSENVQGVINRMIEVMRKAPCLSLAAPQVGVPLRVRRRLILCLLEHVFLCVISSRASIS